MPGKNNTRIKKKQDNNASSKTFFIEPSDGQFVAKVVSAVGNLHFIVEDYDKKTYNARLKNSRARQYSIRADNYVLVESYLNCYEIIHQYTREDRNELVDRGLIKKLTSENHEISFEFKYDDGKQQEEEEEVAPQDFNGDFYKSSDEEEDASSSEESDVDIDNL